jgi:hypothetical protein
MVYKNGQIAFEKLASLAFIQRPTKRAPDVWESARFMSTFLASSFSCSQAESTPAHTQVTPAVGRLAVVNEVNEMNND